MSAYIIATIQVTNPAQYEDYKKLSTQAMQAYGAQVCVRGGPVEVLEGDWHPERVVILRFDSLDKARAFNTSAEYAAARQSRAGASLSKMILVEGVA
jgi:uncharacterized protein (DUF1330 family)